LTLLPDLSARSSSNPLPIDATIGPQIITGVRATRIGARLQLEGQDRHVRFLVASSKSGCLASTQWGHSPFCCRPETLLLYRCGHECQVATNRQHAYTPHPASVRTTVSLRLRKRERSGKGTGKDYKEARKAGDPDLSLPAFLASLSIFRNFRVFRLFAFSIPRRSPRSAHYLSGVGHSLCSASSASETARTLALL
jgi:hypothetical protein